MRNILVPVDFSISCYNAFRYAVKLAEATGRNLVVTHFYRSGYVQHDERMSDENSKIQAEYVQRLQLFTNPANHLRDFDFEELPPEVTVSFEVKAIKSAVDAIVTRGQQADVDLIVMGSRTSPQDDQPWYGSTSIRVSHQCDRPVFLIPREASFHPIKRIVVANATGQIAPYPLWQIKGISNLYQAKVYFLHVDHSNSEAAPELMPWLLMEQLAEKRDADFSFSVASAKDEDLTNGLITYSKQIKADLLILIAKISQKGERTIHQTLTQDVTLRAELPLLILHEEQQYEVIDSVSASGYFRES